MTFIKRVFDLELLEVPLAVGFACLRPDHGFFIRIQGFCLDDLFIALYVAGVDNGSLYCSPYYENEGASLGIAYTSGIVAADCMLEYLG